MHLRFLIACMLWHLCVSAQVKDSLTNKDEAYQQIMSLKDGALVVRLKMNEKSIEAYRKAGRNDIADRMIQEKNIQNQKIVTSFRTLFDFCKVYFIFAKNSSELLANKGAIFLNDSMKVDTSIHIKEHYYLLAEYGETQSNMRTDEYHYKGVNYTEPSSTTASNSAIFISDSTSQLKEPFPFYQAVYLDNYDKAITRLNTGLLKFYYHVYAKTGLTIPTGNKKK